MRKRNKSGSTEKAEFADRIILLRGHFGDTQAEFAKRLGAKQTTVSVWEQGKEDRKPSAEMFFKLGAISPKVADAIWFFERAGLTKQAIIRAAEAIQRHKFEPPEGAETVRVAPLPESKDFGEQPFLISEVPNLSSAGYFVADEWASLYFQRPGIVMVDTTHRGDALRPFWKELVLAKLPFGLCIGFLQRGNFGEVDPVRDDIFFQAGLGGPRGAPEIIGSWGHPIMGERDWRDRIAKLDEAERFSLHMESLHRSSNEMRADHGIEIIGRVTTWDFRALPESDVPK